MNGRSWKTNLGGSLSALGHTLMGIGVVPQLGNMHSVFLTYVAATGFFLSAAGTFFTGLFAQDKPTKNQNNCMP